MEGEKIGYCKYRFLIIEKIGDKIFPCDSCHIKCVHSKTEPEDYLIKE